MMDVETNGVRWHTVDGAGNEVWIHGREEGGLVLAIGDHREAGLIVLDDPAGRRVVAAILNLMDGEVVRPEAADLLPSHYPFPWWGTDNVGEDGIRRGVMIANAGAHVVLCAGRVKAGDGGVNTGAAAIPSVDAERFAGALLALLDGLDPWEVTDGPR